MRGRYGSRSCTGSRFSGTSLKPQTPPGAIDAYINAYSKAEPFVRTKKKVRQGRFKGRRITCRVLARMSRLSPSCEAKRTRHANRNAAREGIAEEASSEACPLLQACSSAWGEPPQ